MTLRYHPASITGPNQANLQDRHHHPGWQRGWIFPAAGAVRRRVYPASVSQPAISTARASSIRSCAAVAHRRAEGVECAVCGCHRVRRRPPRVSSRRSCFAPAPTTQPRHSVSAACRNLTGQDVMTYLELNSGMPAAWPAIHRRT
jgi:hypothetical protein